MRSPEEAKDFELVCEVEATIGLAMQQKGYASLTFAERAFYNVWWVEAEVNNGGFDQYFFNSSGDHAADAVDGLRAVGAEAAAELLSRAIALFPSPGPSAVWEERRGQLLELSENQQSQLEALDTEYYARIDDIERMLAVYARQHLRAK